MVLTREFENIKDHFEKNLDISSLLTGAYILKVSKGNVTESKKLIKN